MGPEAKKRTHRGAFFSRRFRWDPAIGVPPNTLNLQLAIRPSQKRSLPILQDENAVGTARNGQGPYAASLRSSEPPPQVEPTRCGGCDMGPKTISLIERPRADCCDAHVSKLTHPAGLLSASKVASHPRQRHTLKIRWKRHRRNLTIWGLAATL